MIALASVVIVNRSKVHDVAAALPAIVSALNRQLHEHVWPAWMRTLPTVSARAPTASDVQLVILDAADEPDALGYHDETTAGQIFGRAFTKPILDNGGTVASGDNSVSATLSHELLEIVGDPNANLWADGPGGSYAVELCDAVEGDAYDIDGISVSNFVLPAFFDPHGRGRCDYLGKLTKPFQTGHGGYQIRRSAKGAESTVFGAGHVPWRHFGAGFPQWKHDVKATRGSRFARRSGI